MPKCRIPNCLVKRAIFNFPTEKQGVCCGKHKENGMVDFKHSKCIFEGCTKISTCNNLNEKIPLYCSIHKLENMINITSKRCIFERCIKQPYYNDSNEKIPLYCSTHKLENMVDVKSIRCIFEGCNIRPLYNYSNEKISIYCFIHKKDDMINVTSKQCIFENCSTQPAYNYSKEKTPLYCAVHKKKDMIDLKNKLCIFEGCVKHPNYNYQKENKAIYCAVHKKQDMIDIKNKLCIFEECKKYPSCNYVNEKIPIYCSQHKLVNMMDIKHKQCITFNCQITSSNPKYRGYCLRCFMYTFPDEPVTRNYKIKEKHVVDFIDQEFNVNNPIYDKVIQGGCSKRRPDIFIDLFTHSIIIEIDEEQHENYICENKRIMQLFEDLGNRPIVFIRFNPDSYIDVIGKKHLSCFSYHKLTGIPMIISENRWNQRLNILKNTMEKYIKIIPEKEISIEQLFYDGFLV